jgi:hypothetical protein
MGGSLPKRRATPAASPSRGDEHRIDALLSDRDRLMGEITLRARLGSLPPLLAKAQTLLTRFWGKSSWDARAEILSVARMLVVLGAAQPALKAQPSSPPRRCARRSGEAGRQKASRSGPPSAKRPFAMSGSK